MSRSKGQLGDICLEAQRRKHRLLYDNCILSRNQTPRKTHSDHLLANESKHSKVSDGEASELRTCRSDFIRLPAGASPSSCTTNTDGLDHKKQPCNPTKTIANQPIANELVAYPCSKPCSYTPSDDNMQPSNEASNPTHDVAPQNASVQAQPILKYLAVCPCGCPLRGEDPNDIQQPYNESSNSSQTVARQDPIIHTQPIPTNFAECPCGCISSIEGPTPTNDPMPNDFEDVADQNSQSKSHTDSPSGKDSTRSGSGSSSFEDKAERYQGNNATQDTSQQNLASATDSFIKTGSPSFEDKLKTHPEISKDTGESPKDSSTQTNIASPSHSFAQTETVTPRESKTLKDVAVEINKKETDIEIEHQNAQNKSEIVVHSSKDLVLLPTNQDKEDKDHAVSLEKYHKETQNKDSSSLLQQENSDQTGSLQISKDDNDQTASPKGKCDKETQYEDSYTSEGNQNVEKCANCSRVPELLQKIFEMEQKMNQQECSLRQLQCSVRSSKVQSNTDQSTQWEYAKICGEKNENSRPSSSGQKSKNQPFQISVEVCHDANSKRSTTPARNETDNCQKLKKEQFCTQSTENLKEQACNTLLEKLIQMFAKPKDQELDCTCEDLGSSRDGATTSRLDKDNRQNSSTKVIPTESQQNLNDEVCESLIEQFMHMFMKPTTHREDCPCPVQKIHKRNTIDFPSNSTIPQEGNKVKTRDRFTQAGDEMMEIDGKYKSQSAEILMDESQSIDSSQTLGQTSLESRESSLCQFCRDKELPVLDHMVGEVNDLIGSRRLSRIVMTVLLRADNLYHVNIREMGTGCVVGCLLVNDAAIEEAISLGLFEQILTFCVTDVRSTIKPKDGPFAIHFELIEQRERGGGWDEETANTEKVLEFATQVLGLNIGYVSRLFSLTYAIKLDKQAPDCSLRQISQSLIAPSACRAHTNRDTAEYFTSRLILIDNGATYSMRSHSDAERRESLGSSSSMFLRIVTGRADREEHS